MRLFLDTSVLLAACGSTNGSSHALFSYARPQGWLLLTSPYALEEVSRNLPKLPAAGTSQWVQLRPQLTVVDDVVSLDRPTVFTARKDRPILFTALASADILITLDKADFIDFVGRTFYGLAVTLPYEFLRTERAEGRLSL